MKHRLALALTVTASLAIAACGDDDDATTTSTAANATTDPSATTGDAAAPAGSITLVTYDSWSDALDDVVAEFTAATGIEVAMLRAGDTGTMVSKAVLSAGNPEGDVMFGVDNTFLSRVVDADVFEPYEAAGLDTVPAELRALTPGGEATPIDFGDVCINYDKAWFEEHDLTPPADLAALADPAYADLLVVENPASSSPGLAFVLATIAEFGEDGWVDYWAQLARQRRAGRRLLGGRLLRRLLRRQRRRPAARRQLRHEPAGGGRLRRPADRRRHDRGRRHHVLPPDRVRRRAARHRARRRCRAARSTSCWPNGSRPSCRSTCSSTRRTRTSPCRRSSRPTPRSPPTPKTLDPAAITANREAWLETWTDTVVR